MGLLFRRRVTLMPGVRLNLSRSGVSASFGPRGASITVGGKRGPAVNLGLPGTGLYMRQSLGASRWGGLSRTQDARRERQRLRELEREQAVSELQAHERELDALETILCRRDHEPLDWAAEFEASPVPLPGTYEATVAAPTWEDALRDVEVKHSALRWWFSAAAAWAAAWLAPHPATRIALVVVGVALVLGLIRVRRLLPASADRLYQDRRRDFEKADQEAREASAGEDEARRDGHAAAEAMKQAFRELEATANFELASSLLETELTNEDLGVPITFEIGFQDLHRVRLLVVLPPLTVIPAQRARLTKTGKLSRRPMAQRDRKALYEAVCAGVVLRLVYETFRVLPFVDKVQAIGTTTRPGLGKIVHRYAGLALETTRTALLSMDLDDGEPDAILRYLGGQMSLARDGTLNPVEGVDDDLD